MRSRLMNLCYLDLICSRFAIILIAGWFCVVILYCNPRSYAHCRLILYYYIASKSRLVKLCFHVSIAVIWSARLSQVDVLSLCWTEIPLNPWRPMGFRPNFDSRGWSISMTEVLQVAHSATRDERSDSADWRMRSQRPHRYQLKVWCQRGGAVQKHWLQLTKDKQLVRRQPSPDRGGVASTSRVVLRSIFICDISLARDTLSVFSSCQAADMD